MLKYLQLMTVRERVEDIDFGHKVDSLPGFIADKAGQCCQGWVVMQNGDNKRQKVFLAFRASELRLRRRSQSVGIKSFSGGATSMGMVLLVGCN